DSRWVAALRLEREANPVRGLRSGSRGQRRQCDKRGANKRERTIHFRSPFGLIGQSSTGRPGEDGSKLNCLNSFVQDGSGDQPPGSASGSSESTVSAADADAAACAPLT